MAKIAYILASDYDKIVDKTNKLRFTARDARKVRAYIAELARIEELATEYRVLLQARLDYTMRDDEISVLFADDDES